MILFDILFDIVCLYIYISISVNRSKNQSEWKSKGRPANLKKQCANCLKENNHCHNTCKSTQSVEPSSIMFNLLSLLHPNPKSLNNNVDGLQFWNCSLSEGLFIYLTGHWLWISHDVKNNKFGVMLASWVHGLQELAKSLWNLMVTPQLPCKRKRLPLATRCPTTYGDKNPPHCHKKKVNRVAGWFLICFWPFSCLCW